MRIQEISTGGTIQNDDMLFGSQFVSKGNYRNLNFNIKDVINYVKAGLPASSGTLSIQIGEQDADSPYSSPTELINRSTFNVDVPAYGLFFLRMKKNKDGLCDELYLFMRNGNSFGENALQCKETDFLKLQGKETTKEFNEQGNLDLTKEHAGSQIWLQGGNIFIPNNLISGFKAKFINNGAVRIEFMADSNINLIAPTGTMLDPNKSVELIHNKFDGNYYLIGQNA
jgi:hypothetical protein